MNEVQIMTKAAISQNLEEEAAINQNLEEEEEQLATYIDEMHAEVEAEPDPFNLMKLDCSLTTNTPPVRYQCIKCWNSYASTDGVRKHYKNRHGLPPLGPHNYCVTIL